MITGMMARRLTTIADPFSAYLIANLTMQGSHGSTTFTDTTGRAWSAVNNASITTADPDFPTGAATFDGGNDAVETSDSTDFDMGVSLFTIEAFIKVPDTSGVHHIIGQWGTVQRGWVLYTNAGGLGFAVSLDGSTTARTILTSGSAISAGVATHVAVVRNNDHATLADGFQLYVNGTLAGSTDLTAGSALHNSSHNIRIGLDTNNNNDMLGLIAGVKVYKGICKYGGDFTPPEYPFT